MEGAEGPLNLTYVICDMVPFSRLQLAGVLQQNGARCHHLM